MNRIIVHSIGSMPKEASIPLGCVLDKDTPLGPMIVVAYGQGGTFNEAGLGILAHEMRPYVAYMHNGDADDNEPIRLRAIDINAALMWLREHYHGSFALYVQPASTYLGEFDS